MELSQERKNEISGIFIIVFAILLGISLFSNSAGIVGVILKIFFTVLSGKGAYIFPFLFLICGIAVIKSRAIRLSPRLVGLIIVICSFLAFLHVIYIPHGNELPAALEQQGGGFIGCVISYFLRSFLGQIGSYIVLSALTLIGLLLFFDIFLISLFTTIKERIRAFWQRVKNCCLKVKDKVYSLKKVFKRKAKPQNNSVYGEQDEDQDDIFLEELAFDENEDLSLNVQQDFVSAQILNPEEVDDKGPKDSAEDKKNKNSKRQASIGETKTKAYQLPPLKLLSGSSGRNKSEARDQSKLLEDTLQNFGVQAKVISVNHGPTITRYELQPAPGVKVSRIVNLSDDIALAMAATDVRIEAPIPGKAAVGVEVPNLGSSMVKLRDILESNAFKQSNSPLTLALGVDIAGEPVVTNLAGMPHLLVAGATGSGKSVCINTLILSILYKARPDEVKFLLVDPKKVEMTVYKELPHLLAPVVTDVKKASAVLKMVVQEMENRYELFAETGTRGIEGYNQLMRKRLEMIKLAEKEGKEVDESLKDSQPLPYIVVIIDELADLMMVAANDVEDAICRLAQMARAAGIHLIIATQRPSVDVITGLIKANIPSRIAFAVSSSVDSRTILDVAGAEKLLGKGDMLFSPIGASKPKRLQGPFVSTEEVQKVVDFVRNQDVPEYASPMQNLESGEIELMVDEEQDELYEEAVRIVVSSSASISMLQRRLHIGYTRAARMIDMMERDGIVGPYVGSKPREVLVTEVEIEEILNNKKNRNRI